MFHMLSCFNLDPDQDLDAFQKEYRQFYEVMRELKLVETTGPIGKRQTDTEMDTDEERNHQYFVIMGFKDRAQVDAAYDYIENHESPKDFIHTSVYTKVRDSIFICWEDLPA